MGRGGPASGRHGTIVPGRARRIEPSRDTPRTGEAPLETLWLVLGILLLGVAIVDALWTTLWVDGGAGPVSARMTTWAWRGVLAVFGREHHRRLSLFGPASLVAVVMMWVLLLWAGWVFVYASEPSSLLETQDYERHPGWTGRIFFVAYSMFTMGNGDYIPNGGTWDVAASLTTLSGFFLATLAISYILSVLGAVVAKRAFASQVTGMGKTAEEALTGAWNGRDFHTLDLGLSGLSTELAALTEQYLSYPVLQYYHGARPAKSPAVAIAILDETLTLLRFGVAEECRPNVAVLGSARAGVHSYLQTLKSAFIEPADETPPPPDLGRLREAGIPTVGDAEFARALEDLAERRRRLLGLLRNDGWNWGDR